MRTVIEKQNKVQRGNIRKKKGQFDKYEKLHSRKKESAMRERNEKKKQFDKNEKVHSEKNGNVQKKREISLTSTLSTA